MDDGFEDRELALHHKARRDQLFAVADQAAQITNNGLNVLAHTLNNLDLADRVAYFERDNLNLIRGRSSGRTTSSTTGASLVRRRGRRSNNHQAHRQTTPGANQHVLSPLPPPPPPPPPPSPPSSDDRGSQSSPAPRLRSLRSPLLTSLAKQISILLAAINAAETNPALASSI